MIFKQLKNLKYKIGLLPLIFESIKRYTAVEQQLDDIRAALGRIENRQLASNESNELSSYEFKIFSQFGEDGIIQHLLRHVPIENKTFVEFGVEDYTEANTRFLLVSGGWSGLIIDGNENNIDLIKNSNLYWRHDLKAVAEFVTKDNINQIFLKQGITGDIGLLSVDVDGNDYWIWKAINVISPVIVVVEYNHRFGSSEAVTIPYSADFVRTKAHHSKIYFGASLKALWLLAKEKGYVLVGCTSNGLNAFFVRQDKMPQSLREVSPEEGFKKGLFSEARNEDGTPLELSWEEENRLVMSLPLVQVDKK
jgi:hypothetical protein